MWEYLKYEIRKFPKNFSKEAARSKKTESSTLETKLKILESKTRYRITVMNIFAVKKNMTNYIEEKITVL